MQESRHPAKKEHLQLTSAMHDVQLSPAGLDPKCTLSQMDQTEPKELHQVPQRVDQPMEEDEQIEDCQLNEKLIRSESPEERKRMTS